MKVFEIVLLIEVLAGAFAMVMGTLFVAIDFWYTKISGFSTSVITIHTWLGACCFFMALTMVGAPIALVGYLLYCICWDVRGRVLKSLSSNFGIDSI